MLCGISNDHFIGHSDQGACFTGSAGKTKKADLLLPLCCCFCFTLKNRFQVTSALPPCKTLIYVEALTIELTDESKRQKLLRKRRNALQPRLVVISPSVTVFSGKRNSQIFGTGTSRSLKSRVQVVVKPMALQSSMQAVITIGL